MDVLLVDSSHDLRMPFEQSVNSSVRFFNTHEVADDWKRVVLHGGGSSMQRTFNKSGYGKILIDPEGRVVSTDIRLESIKGVIEGAAAEPIAVDDADTADDNPLAPKVTVSAVAPGQDGTITLTMQVPDGWHFYGSKETMGVPTSVTVDDHGGLTVEPAIVPAGRIHMRDRRPSYELSGTVKLVVPFTAPDAAGTHTVSGSVRFMMCDEERCLPPDEIAWTARVMVAK